MSMKRNVLPNFREEYGWCQVVFPSLLACGMPLVAAIVLPYSLWARLLVWCGLSLFCGMMSLAHEMECKMPSDYLYEDHGGFLLSMFFPPLFWFHVYRNCFTASHGKIAAEAWREMEEALTVSDDDEDR